MLKMIRNLQQAEDNDIIVIKDLNGKTMARGHWYEDNILSYVDMGGQIGPYYWMFIEV